MENWYVALQPLINKYGKQKHPLNYSNRYQLMMAVILSAQDSDRHINQVAPDFFKAVPSLEELKKYSAEDLYPYLNSVRGFTKKCEWLIKIAQIVGEDSKIPSSLDELVKLPGIGRKSANVIIRESGGAAEGIIVDLHVIRVAPRIGVASGTNAEKIEKQLMQAMPKEAWNEVGMAISFHGREICRPQPKCGECIVNSVCEYYRTVVKS